jgi:hypothetical protein
MVDEAGGSLRAPKQPTLQGLEIEIAYLAIPSRDASSMRPSRSTAPTIASFLLNAAEADRRASRSRRGSAARLERHSGRGGKL